MISQDIVVLVPSTHPSHGSGHLIRMIRLHLKMENSVLLISDYSHSKLKAAFPELETCRIITDPEHSSIQTIKLFVVDMPAIDYSMLMRFKKIAPLAAVDLGGQGRTFVDYLIDSLPYPGNQAHKRYFSDSETGYPSKCSIPGFSSRDLSIVQESRQSNIYSPGMLRNGTTPDSSENPGRRSSTVKRILVSFGGSDPAGLTDSFVSTLNTDKNLRNFQGHIIPPRVYRENDRVNGSSPTEEKHLPVLPEGWAWMSPVDNFPSILGDYDLFISAYGLSAWEAQFSGLPALLLDASDYHRSLAVLSGFISIPPEELSALSGELAGSELLNQLKSQVHRLSSIEPASLFQHITSLEIHGSAHCPCCGTTGPNPVVYRNESRSYFACSKCATVYLFRVTPDSFQYDEQYFFSQYKQQYGKTYVEDFAHIKAMGNDRLHYIQKHLHLETPSPALLDIGCAYGPFLSAAAAKGFNCEGIDISPKAVEYVQSQLGISARSGDISDPEFRRSFPGNHFSVVTMWYVIEHFPELQEILSWIRRILKPWGVFAFSTPSNRGISGRRNLQTFLKNGPEDHFTVWNPVQTARVAKEHGFLLVHDRSTGHHPERFPSVLSSPRAKGVTSLISRSFALGDSFEAYLINIPDEKQSQ